MRAVIATPLGLYRAGCTGFPLHSNRGLAYDFESKWLFAQLEPDAAPHDAIISIDSHSW